MGSNMHANNVCRHDWDRVREERRELREQRRISNVNNKRRKLLISPKKKEK